MDNQSTTLSIFQAMHILSDSDPLDSHQFLYFFSAKKKMAKRKFLISNYQISNYSNTMAQVNHSWSRKLRVPPSTQPLHVGPMRKDTHPPVIIVATHASSCQVCDQS